MKIRNTLGTGLVLAALASPGLLAQTEEPADLFVEQIQVTAVEIRIDVRDKKGRLPLGLSAADFEVHEDGRPVEILGLDPPEAVARMTGEAPILPEPGLEDPALPPREVWRYLVYIDVPMSSGASIRRNALTLADMVPELVERGPMEIVVADPLPEVRAAFTRDVSELRGVLLDLQDDYRPLRHDIADIRREFFNVVDSASMPGTYNTPMVIQQARVSGRQEYFLVQQQLRIFQDWIATYGPSAASAVILVHDGFDFQPFEFYISAVAEETLEFELGPELIEYRLDDVAEDMAKYLASRGWTSLVLASRGQPSDYAGDASLGQSERFRAIFEGSGSANGRQIAAETSMLLHPFEPLLLTVESTGGELLTSAKKTLDAVTRLDQRFRLVYQASRPADGESHALEVRLKRKGLRVTAPQWVSSPTPEQVAESRAQRLLFVADERGEIPVQVNLMTRSSAAAEGKGKERSAELGILFDLSPFQAALPRPNAPIRFTVGVALKESRPFLHQELVEVPVPDWDALPAGQPLPKFRYKIALSLPPETERLSVIVEEAKSGLWGGTVREYRVH